MVKAQKKGEAGPSVNYVTRNKAIRTLQITLKDFRRLCILKGIYPRDPPKKKHGKDKTYYHIKDIKFLRHEPLLQALRDDKARLKKLKKAIGRQDKTRVEALKAGKPSFKVDHIVKERYPTFLDALRDLDDALCMVFLFASLPTKTVPYHDAVVAATCVRLVREWQSYVFHTNALRKTFVSIKGVYYQAEVQAQTITWLVPHKFSPNIPSDVDYRVMLTFLEFYTSMMKFVLFKLYFDVGLKYPPLLDATKDANAEGLNLLSFESLTGKTDAKAASAAGAGADAKDLRDGTKQISGAVLNKLAAAAKSSGAAAAAADAAAAAADAEEAKADAVDTQLFDKLNRDAPVLTAAQTEELKVKRLFAGLTFFIAREVPGDPLEFILLNGSARVLREDGGASAQDDSSITHMIVDRPVQSHRLLVREYVQPQWVFDSFNTRALLPTTPYAPGATPPPHLSPFVDDEKEGYVPKQRKVLQEWGAAATAAANGSSAPAAAAAADDADADADAEAGAGDGFDSDSDNDHDLEQYELDAQEERVDAAPQVAGTAAAAYAQALSNALAGKPAAAAAAAADAEDADGDADGEGEDDGESEGEGEGEGEDGDAKASARAPAAAAKAKAGASSAAAAAAAKPGGKRKAAEAAAADAAARIMMPKKDKRLLHRMEHGIKKKADANAALEARRQQLEAVDAKPTPKRQKKH